MVRPRIGPLPPEATAASVETLEGTFDPAHAQGGVRAPAPCDGADLGGLLGELMGRFVTPLCDRATDLLRHAVTNGSLTLGCLLALSGGCGEPGPRVDVGGLVIDDRTGAPIAGAELSTDDGFHAATDRAGRFELSMEKGEGRGVTASARGHAPVHESVDVRPGVEVVIRLLRTHAPSADARPPAHPGDTPALPLDDDARLEVATCAPCHEEIAREWTLSAMAAEPHGASTEDPACASCHSAQAFVAARSGRATETQRDPGSAISCGACHDPHVDDGAFGLRVDDVSEPIAGAPFSHLGSGALCASCHRSTAEAIDAAPHAPQADMLVGRGARSTPAIDDGAHRHIADTCARCHMVPARERAGGHTFSVRASHETTPDRACAPCHGDVPSSTIGARDWNGDGVAGPVADELADSLARAGALLRARIRALGVHDTCDDARVAVDVVDHVARVHLVDDRGRLLGDCDGNARFTEDEAAITAGVLPAELSEAAYDVLLLRRDGSLGAHNPAYAFQISSAVMAALD